MITPRFSCSQTDTAVIVSMYCPSIRAADVEINVDEMTLTVHVKPYFLRLNFSHALLDDDESSAQYDPSSGYLTITMTKENKGQDFKDLDLLAKLLAPRTTTHQPVIEVLSSDNENESDMVSKIQSLSLAENLSQEQEEIKKAAQNDWQLPQQAPETLVSFETSLQKYYGFLNMHHGYLRHVIHTENEVNELGADAETCTVDERTKRRIDHEDEKWDDEHYMADYMDDEYIQELLGWTHPLTDGPFEYTEKENAEMLRLPRKEYIATPQQTHNLYLTLVTILYSYAYDARTTQLDPTPESAWTMCALTPAFSALDPPNVRPTTGKEPLNFSQEEVTAAIIPSYRRSLAFPLYRSFYLVDKCRTDVADFLAKGRRMVMRCLLRMKDILDHHEVYYVYSKIWLDDFCLWISAYADDEILEKLGKVLAEIKVAKALIGWNLEELETAALESLERESDSDDMSSEDSDDFAHAPL